MSASATLSWKLAEPTTTVSVCAGVVLPAVLGFVGLPLPQAVTATAAAARATPKSVLLPLIGFLLIPIAFCQYFGREPDGAVVPFALGKGESPMRRSDPCELRLGDLGGRRVGGAA